MEKSVPQTLAETDCALGSAGSTVECDHGTCGVPDSLAVATPQM